MRASWTKEDAEAFELKKKMEKPPTEVGGLTVRVINTLEEAGVLLVGELMAKTSEELLGVPNLGDKTLNEVGKALKAMGLSPPWYSGGARRRRK